MCGSGVSLAVAALYPGRSPLAALAAAAAQAGPKGSGTVSSTVGWVEELEARLSKFVLDLVDPISFRFRRTRIPLVGRNG